MGKDDVLLDKYKDIRLIYSEHNEEEYYRVDYVCNHIGITLLSTTDKYQAKSKYQAEILKRYNIAFMHCNLELKGE